MTDNDPTEAAPSEAAPSEAAPTEAAPTEAAPTEAAPDTSQPSEDPGYLVQTGEAVGEDGSVVPIIGGLPAVEGSAWDIGAPADERGANLADEQQASHPNEPGAENTSSA